MTSKTESQKQDSASPRKSTTQQEPPVEVVIPEDLIVRARTKPNRLSPTDIVSIQRLVGNAATGRLLNRVVQRDNGDSEDEEASPPVESEVETRESAEEETSPSEESEVETGESAGEETSPPAETEIETEEATEEVPRHPPEPTRSPLSNAAAQRILTTAFGSITEIAQGTIAVLGQAAFQAAYDSIYGAVLTHGLDTLHPGMVI